MSKNGVGELMPAPFTKISTRSKFLQHVGEQLLQAGFGSRVARKKLRLAAAFGDVVETRLRLWRIASDERHGCAGNGQTFGHLAAQHARAADDDRDFAFE